MIEDGTIAEDDPVELIEGVVVQKMPRNPPHRVSTRKTAKALEQMVPAGWYVAVQEAIVIKLDSKPEPDVSVVPAELEFDTTRDPLAAECCLVVEVADSSLEYDRTKKLALYAAAGIPVYWIVNLRDRVVEVHTDPESRGGSVRRPRRLRSRPSRPGHHRRPGRRHDRRG